MLVVSVAPIPVSHAQKVRVEAKGLPDDGGGRIVRTPVTAFGDKLDLTLGLNIQFVPLQADLERLEEQVHLAQELLCDATDGRVDLVRVQANLGRAAAEHSDIWWRRGLGQTSHAGNHIVLNDAAFMGTTLAHEIGHYVLNLLDSYAARSDTDGCEFGPAFDFSQRTPDANTIMEASGGRVCVDQRGRTHDRADPISFAESVTCTTGADCPDDGRVLDTDGVALDWTCELDPFGSELGTRSNQDLLMGDFSTRAPSDVTWTGQCPNAGTPTSQLELTGRFINPLADTCDNGVLDPSEECGDDGRMNIECDETGRPDAANASGSAGCFRCRWDTSRCTTTGCNNDGVLDPGEQCDTTPGTYTCENLGYGTGMPFCNANCTLSVASCMHPPPAFDLTNYERLRSSSQLEHEDMWLLDDAARIGHRWKRGESEHRLRAYANRVSTDHWSLLFVMDGGEFAGGAAADTPQEIARFDLEFDAMNVLSSINGLAVDADGCTAANECPSLVLGSGGASAPFGVPTNGSAGQTVPTGTWTPMDDMTVAGELTLQLDLRDVTRERIQQPNGGAASQGFLRAKLSDSAGLPAIGLCGDDDWCRVSWNEATQQFESTNQSRLVLTDMVRTGSSLAIDADNDTRSDLAETEERADWFRLASTWGVPEALNVDTGTPPISTCGATASGVGFGDVEIPAQFVMVLDRSGSMEATAPQSSETRLEMMQQAARNTVNLYSGRKSYDPGLSESDGSPCNDGDGDGDGQEDARDPDCQRATRVGLVTFNDQTCVDPSGGAVCVPLAEIGPAMMQTPAQTYIDAIDRLAPSGWTGIGTAMRVAEGQLDMRSAQRKALLVLSDGENNRPEGILCKPPMDLVVGEVNDPMCPYAVAEDLRRQGVLVITIPLGSSTDSFGMQQIADLSGGEMLSAYRDDEVIPVFLHAYALSRAEKPVIARRDVFVARSGVGGVFLVNQTDAVSYQGLDEVTIPVPVEQGAQRLNLLMSVRAQASDVWRPTFTLLDPSGAVELTELDGRVRSSATSRLISVEDPVAGEWSIVVRPTFSVELSHFAAHVENPLPGCSLKLSTHVTDGTESVVAKLEAHYDSPLRHEDVRYNLVIRSIDGTITEIADFDTSDPDGPATATLDPALIQFHGRYDLVAQCRVGDINAAVVSAAVRRRGEVPGGAEVLEFESDPVPAFLREDRATLSVVNGNWPPITNCPNNDCDNDGILNPDEPTDDLDGDGVPGPWDDNADGDEVADSMDPDPTDPSVPGAPPHPGCTSDTDPPEIDAPAIDVTGCVGLVRVDPGIMVSDDSCPNDSLIDVSGRMLTRDGESVDLATTFPPNALELPAGDYVFEWTATDVHGNARSVSQNITVAVDSSSISACCPIEAAVYEGNGLPNVFILPRAVPKCVLGRGLWDAIVTGAGTDYLSGGSGGDFIESRGTNDTLAGGSGRDLLLLPVGASGKIYGESGDDTLELTGTGVIIGGHGDDVMLGAFGDQAFTPGPGTDVVIAGSGDDVVRIYDACELEPFELLDGGSGYDTLFTPVPVTDLLSRGVLVVGFENVIVSTAERHLSECQ